MHQDANMGLDCCKLSTCHAADSDARRRNRSATRRRGPAPVIRMWLSAPRPVSSDSPTPGARRRRRSASAPRRSTGVCCRSSRRWRWVGTRALSRSTSSSASRLSDGERPDEQNAGRQRALAASRVYRPRWSHASAISTPKARASARSHVSSIPTLYQRRRVAASGGLPRCAPFSSARVRLLEPSPLRDEVERGDVSACSIVERPPEIAVQARRRSMARTRLRTATRPSSAVARDIPGDVGGHPR